MMGNNIAARRGAKAQRRKVVVAEKRKADAVLGSKAGQISAAAKLPVCHCRLQDGLFENGMGALYLIRGVSGGPCSVGMFLIDSFCLGVKDVGFRMLGAQEVKTFISKLDDVSPARPIDPATARKLLRDVTTWAKSAGFNPHPDFAVVEKLFGDVDPNASDAVFEFGYQGQPLYVPGPHESAAEVRERVETAVEAGAHYLVPV